MKKETKLKKVKEFLRENNIKYTTSRHAGEPGHSDLVVWDYRMYIKMEGEDDALFYRWHKKGVFPVFIREKDTPKFVLEKVQNTIIKFLQREQAQYLKKHKSNNETTK